MIWKFQPTTLCNFVIVTCGRCNFESASTGVSLTSAASSLLGCELPVKMRDQLSWSDRNVNSIDTRLIINSTIVTRAVRHGDCVANNRHASEVANMTTRTARSHGIVVRATRMLLHKERNTVTRSPTPQVNAADQNMLVIAVINTVVRTIAA